MGLGLIGRSNDPSEAAMTGRNSPKAERWRVNSPEWKKLQMITSARRTSSDREKVASKSRKVINEKLEEGCEIASPEEVEEAASGKAECSSPVRPPGFGLMMPEGSCGGKPFSNARSDSGVGLAFSSAKVAILQMAPETSGEKIPKRR